MNNVPMIFIRRNKDLCTTCKKCVDACPNRAMSFDLASNYLWTECTHCDTCIQGCPEKALSLEKAAKASWDDCKIRYFREPGPQNTQGLIEAVKERLQQGDINTVACGSMSGGSTSLLADAGLPNGTKVVSISAPSPSKTWGGKAFLPILDRGKEELKKRGVVSLENGLGKGSEPCHSSNVPHAFEISYLAFCEMLIDVGGMGLKVAVVSVLSACFQKAIPPGERVIGLGGTWCGFDTAAVIHATTNEAAFGPDPQERLTIEEIIAMPRLPRRYQ